MLSFGLLFTPTAARLLVRGQHQGMATLYRQTSLWVTTLASPIFLVTFAASRGVTLLLFGERYHRAADTLAILALGYFLTTIFGLPVRALRVWGKEDLAVASIAYNLFVPRPLAPSTPRLATKLIIVNAEGCWCCTIPLWSRRTHLAGAPSTTRRVHPWCS